MDAVFYVYPILEFLVHFWHHHIIFKGSGTLTVAKGATEIWIQ